METTEQFQGWDCSNGTTDLFIKLIANFYSTIYGMT
jgi:hypothetical protein